MRRGWMWSWYDFLLFTFCKTLQTVPYCKQYKRLYLITSSLRAKSNNLHDFKVMDSIPPTLVNFIIILVILRPLNRFLLESTSFIILMILRSWHRFLLKYYFNKYYLTLISHDFMVMEPIPPISYSEPILSSMGWTVCLSYQR